MYLWPYRIKAQRIAIERIDLHHFVTKHKIIEKWEPSINP